MTGAELGFDRDDSKFRPRAAVIECDRCGQTPAVVQTFCPTCGPVPLCGDCTTAHVIELEMEGRSVTAGADLPCHD